MKNKFQLLAIAIFVIVFDSIAQSTDTETFKDSRDGKVYKTIKIGTQTIMAENLAYKPGSGNCWAYDNDAANLTKYGYLYDWETAKKIAPQGWHLPSKDEWDLIFTSAGNEENIVFNALSENGSTGFNNKICGYRTDNGYFSELDYACGFWSATAEDPEHAFVFWFNYGPVLDDPDFASIFSKKNGFGFSVRLIKD